MAQAGRNEIRTRIHKRIRRRVAGTQERPRLAVFRSLNHIYAQVIDDQQGHTLAAAASTEKSLQDAVRGKGGNIEGAKLIGEAVAKRAKEKGISRVVFDRGGYQYHGRVKALADAARQAGLEF
jgi:large subunit ribosomal protein L18